MRDIEEQWKRSRVVTKQGKHWKGFFSQEFLHDAVHMTRLWKFDPQEKTCRFLFLL